MRTLTLACLSFLLLAGCASDDGGASEPALLQPEGGVVPLESVPIPATFTFETTRTALITLTPPAQARGVELRREGGALVFAGRAPSAPLRLPLPPHEANLEATWQLADGSTTQVSVPVAAEVKP